MNKKSIDDVDVASKRVLVRVDFNVPLDKTGAITDDTRIRAALPTLEKLLAGGAALILMSHLGRPKGKPEDRERLTLAPVADRLGALLDRRVEMAPDCVGEAVRAAAERLTPGDVLLLENLRFHAEETIKDKKAADDPALRERKDTFARQLAKLADVYVNDAFGTCHRDNASMLTVPQMMAGKPRVVGYLVRKELAFLGKVLTDPDRPFVCVLGGAKVRDKIGVIRAMLGRCDLVLIGGAMAYTFMAAEGLEVGDSRTEPDQYDLARSLRAEGGDRLVLPTDSVAARAIESDAERQVVTDGVPAGWMGLDIGPDTSRAYGERIRGGATVVWNGPMGVFETPPFDAGTLAVAKAMVDATQQDATTVVGGGDSAAAVTRLGLADRLSHVSTGGGACLEFLEGKPFETIGVLDDA